MVISRIVTQLDGIIRRHFDGRVLARLDGLVGRSEGNPGKLSLPLDLGRTSCLEAYLSAASRAATRELGTKPHRNQLLAAAALIQGFGVELDTGEGKTLVAAIVAAAHALAGRDVHVLTANDYLAARDAQWMAPFYRHLGVSCAAVPTGIGGSHKRAAYGRNVTYASAKEAGFDLLRDRLSTDPGSRTGAKREVLILDEADAILLDEARTPLVLAGEAGETGEGMARRAGAIVEALSMGVHYELTPDKLTANFTAAGLDRIENDWPGADLFDGSSEVFALLNVALHAAAVMERDVDYVVDEGRVWLVSPATGRVDPLQRWPDGLQLAIEVKEGLRSQGGMSILDQIVVAELIDAYTDVTGLSATMQASADEIERVYGIRTLRVPPEKPCVRVDHPTRLFQTQDESDRELVAVVQAAHEIGRPVLLACQSVADSERCSELLASAGLEHVLLNAKNDRDEADVIEQAGQSGRITVSTQMAGRGTDIKLTAAARMSGGLYVIGKGNFPNARLDAQMRGRAGRQGDPGDSLFISSLEDEQIRHAAPQVPLPREVAANGLIKDRKVQWFVSHAQRVKEGEQEGLRTLSWRYGRLLRTQREEVIRRREDCFNGAVALGLLRDHNRTHVDSLASRITSCDASAAARSAVILSLDEAWSDHLALAAEVREGIHLRVLVKEDPLVEFERVLATAFPGLLESALTRAVDLLQSSITHDGGVDLSVIHAVVPSASWAYTVTDNSLGSELERLGRGLFSSRST